MPGLGRNLSDTIDAAYAAAVGAGRWEGLLASVCELCGGSNSTIDVVDMGRGQVLAQYNHGLDPHFAELFAKEHVRDNPLTQAVVQMDNGQISSGRQLIGTAALEGSRFYNDWCVPQGSFDNSISLLAKRGNLYSILQVTYPTSAGFVDQQKTELITSISPHICRAVDVSIKYEQEIAIAQTDKEWISSKGIGMAVVSGSSTILKMNSNFEEVIRRQPDIVSVSGSELVLHPMEAAFQLKLIAGRQGGVGSFQAYVAKPVLVRSKAGDELEIEIFPALSHNPFLQFSDAPPMAHVCIRDLGQMLVRGARELAVRFGLTEAERNALLGIGKARSRTETAQLLNITEHTLKTHLNRLFDKTGTSRQTELLALLNRFSF